MTAKEYLKQYQYAVDRVRRYEEEYENESLLIDAIRSASDNDGMPHGSGISKPTEDKAIRLADRALRLTEARLEAIQIRQEVFDFISDIDDYEGEILFQRYVNLLKWEEVCVAVHLSWYAVHDHHRKALAIVQKRLDKKST